MLLSRRLQSHIILGWGLSVLVGMGGAASPPVEASVELPTYRVRGNPVEDFGFRVSPDFDPMRKAYTPVVDLVLPNTAADRAGIRPGERIVAADGFSTSSGSRALATWQGLQKRKWQQLKDGSGALEWTLEVEAAWTAKSRTVVLTLPIAAPRWGASEWSPPPARPPSAAGESGPLAERAREVWGSGIWMLLRTSYARGFGYTTDAENPYVLGYQWTLWDERGGHRLFVTRQRGATEIVFEFIARPNHRFGGPAPTDSPDPSLASDRTVLGSKAWAYLTTPRGELNGALRLGRSEALPLAGAQSGFEQEKTFWLNRAGKVSARWPLELISTKAKR